MTEILVEMLAAGKKLLSWILSLPASLVFVAGVIGGYVLHEPIKLGISLVRLLLKL